MQSKCHMSTDSSPACLSSLVGQWVLCFLRSQVLLLDPFHPAQQIRLTQHSIWSDLESCNPAERIQNSSLFKCVSHFLSKHSWETHPTLWIKNSKLHYQFRLHTADIHSSTATFATTLLINSAHLVSFHSTFTAIASRTLMDYSVLHHIRSI